MLGTTPAFVSQLETGHRSPSATYAKKIEKMTNGEVTAAELLGIVSTGVNETPREFKHAATLQIDLSEDDLKDAARFGLDAKEIARRAVEEKLKQARLKAWVAENQAAFDAHAKDVEENGLWSEELRQF